MSSNWNSTNSILRKTNQPQQQIQQNSPSISSLLVFGYECKIFRDDEKAIYIDQGKHLIPWMGDENLKIDRYDVRATLPDLTQYEPPPGGYINRLDYLSPAEQRAEQLCEEERYYSLYHNEEDEQLYQEEELKRLQQQTSLKYGQVEFSYDDIDEQIQLEDTKESSSVEGEDENDKSDEPDELYTPPIGLNIPESIEKPETMKLHAIIEKTAKFISTQGPQMEILIKAKQSNNQQFEFLNINNNLNPYYKFILNLFKNGTYPEKNENDSGTNKTDSDQVGGDDDSLNNDQNSFVYPSISIPTIKYKPSANCAYTQLISKIKGVPLPPEQPYLDETNLETTAPTLITHHAYQANLRNAVTASSTAEIEEKNEKSAKNEVQISKTEQVEIKKISSGLALAQCYASDTEEENESSESEQQQQNSISTIEDPATLNILIPPEHLRHIIDKTAAYVIKNGQQFEEILRTKKDARFTFLDSCDEYHQYYMYKVTGIVNPYPTSNGIVEDNDDDDDDDNSNKPKIMTPVSFSIKAKEESSVSIKPALPQEISDDESELKNQIADDASQFNAVNIISNQINQNSSINPVTKATVPEHVQRAIQLVESQLMSRGTVTVPKPVSLIAPVAITNTLTNSNVSEVTVDNEISQKSIFDIDNTAITVKHSSSFVASSVKNENSQQKELKRAEEKVKDRLAQIAKEKLKEKQLQIERKKKAMAFLNQIKNSEGVVSSSVNTSDETTEDHHENEIVHNVESDSTSSIHSIPISSQNKDDNERITRKPEIMIKKDKIDSSKISKSTKLNEKNIQSRSRSRSHSKSSKSHIKQKKSKHHSKKKSKKKSRSRSRSRSRSKHTSSTVKKINNYHNKNNNRGSNESRQESDRYHYHYHNHDRHHYKNDDDDRHRRRRTYDDNNTKRNKRHSSRSPSASSSRCRKKKRD